MDLASYYHDCTSSHLYDSFHDHNEQCKGERDSTKQRHRTHSRNKSNRNVGGMVFRIRINRRKEWAKVPHLDKWRWQNYGSRSAIIPN